MSSLSPPTTWSKSSLSTGSLSPTGSRGRSLSPLRGNLGSSPSASQPERLYIIDDSSDEGLTEDKDVETVVGAEVRDSDYENDPVVIINDSDDSPNENSVIGESIRMRKQTEDELGRILQNYDTNYEGDDRGDEDVWYEDYTCNRWANRLPDTTPSLGESTIYQSIRKIDDDAVCCLCAGPGFFMNSLVTCDACHTAYHQTCHLPKIPDYTVRLHKRGQSWVCSTCFGGSIQIISDQMPNKRQSKTFNEQFIFGRSKN